MLHIVNDKIKSPDQPGFWKKINYSNV